MANIKHLEILNEGIELWNQWREDHPTLIPDLCGAVITFTDLSNINLRQTQLKKAILSSTNLL